MVDLVNNEEGNERETSEDDGDAANKPMEVEMDVTPLRVELPQPSLSRMTEEELALLRRNDPIGYMKAKLAQRDIPLARDGIVRLAICCPQMIELYSLTELGEQSLMWTCSKCSNRIVQLAIP